MYSSFPFYSISFHIFLASHVNSLSFVAFTASRLIMQRLKKSSLSLLPLCSSVSPSDITRPLTSPRRLFSSQAEVIERFYSFPFLLFVYLIFSCHEITHTSALSISIHRQGCLNWSPLKSVTKQEEKDHEGRLLLVSVIIISLCYSLFLYLYLEHINLTYITT